MMLLSLVSAAAGIQHHRSFRANGLVMKAADAPRCVSFVNPLEVDGFAEPGGWGDHAANSSLPMLVFLPGMDGSLCTPFMQYPELATRFELSCMRHVEGLSSRVTFDKLTADVVAHVEASMETGRRVLLVGESFGASLAVAVAAQIDEDPAMMGLVVVNPATSYRRSALATVGPVCGALSGPFLYPLYLVSLVALAALVLTPATQAPAFLALLASLKSPTLLANPYRESYLGRVALSAFLGQRGPGLEIGSLLAINVFAPEDLAFRLSEWLAPAADVANEALPHLVRTTPILAVVGDTDRLLPSLDESARLAALAAPHETWRGTVVVPGAGHASTLGTRVNLLAEIRGAFATELANNPDSDAAADAAAVGRLATPPLLPCDESEGWARGLLDRTYEPVPPKDYLRYSRGGDLYPGGRTGGN